MGDNSKKLANILLVDDSIEDIVFTEAMFEQSHVAMHLSYVRDGSEAIAYLQSEEPFEDAIRPDLIFLDLSMPQISGMDVLAFIKKESSLKDIPVVICSGSDAESDILKSRELGAVDYIVKPLNYKKLQDAITQIDTLQIVSDDNENAILKDPDA